MFELKSKKRRRRSGRTPHTRRPEAVGLVHVTLKLCAGLPQMRSPKTYRVLERAFREAKDRNGMRLNAFAVMGDHLHIIVDVENKEDLSRGMQGLSIRLAKALNKRWGRKGPQGCLQPHATVWRDRFFGVLLESFWQVRRAFRYVLLNAKKHGYMPKSSRRPDPYSSGRWFQWCDWVQDFTRPLREPPPQGRLRPHATVPPRSWTWIPHVSLSEWPGQPPEIVTPEVA